jgi:hypothetical protein
VQRELASADRVDLLCAFVEWLGLRVVCPAAPSPATHGAPRAHGDPRAIRRRRRASVVRRADRCRAPPLGGA